MYRLMYRLILYFFIHVLKSNNFEFKFQYILTKYKAISLVFISSPTYSLEQTKNKEPTRVKHFPGIA